MVDPVAIVTLVVACIASLFMAWAIGAGSAGSTPFAPAVGANAISVMRAGFFVGLFAFLGAAIQGQNVSETVGRELIGDVTLFPAAAALALLIAAGLVAIGVFTGYPIATAFTVTGAVIGVGLGIGGDPAWTQWLIIALMWTLTPFAGGGMAYVTARILRSDFPERRAVPMLGAVVGLIVAYMDIAALGGPDGSSSIAGATADALVSITVLGVDLVGLATAVAIAGLCAVVIDRQMTANPVAGQRRFLLAMGALVAFSAGGSQVGLAIGPLLPLLEPQGIPMWAILVGGGLGLLIGSWTGAPRMIKAISQDYSSLGPRRSIAALIPSFAIAQVAVLLGVPVSFNEIVVSAIIGSGYAAGNAGVSRRKMLYTMLAWVGSLSLAIVLGYVIVVAFSATF